MGGLSCESNIVGKVPKVTKAFYTIRNVVNFPLPYSESFVASSSDIIAADIMNPIIHPIGIDSPLNAVESARSLSPNHKLASLLYELIKNPWAKAAIIVPRKTISK